MATMPAFLRRPADPGPAPAPRMLQGRSAGEFDLRALPLDDVFFFCKRINNERLVREADPRASGRCWSAIAAASLMLMLLAGVASLRMMNTLAGYRIEELKGGQQQMADRVRALQLQESVLLNPENLQQVAKERGLGAPEPGQVVHLEPKGEGAMAAVLSARGRAAE
jgi:hypothetical protein